MYTTDESSTNDIQNVRSAEVKTMFIEHVRKVIFELNEPRTLLGLLQDFKDMYGNYGFDVTAKKSSYIKIILHPEFDEQIGFHNRYQKNESTLVFDCNKGGTFIEGAINSWGVTNEQLLNTVARRLKDKFSTDLEMPWPPSVEELEAEEEPDPLLTKFVIWLQNASEKTFETDPQILALTSLLKSYITGRRSTFKTKLSCTLHGLTKSREIVDLMKKFGIGISYQDVKDLYATWTNHEIKHGCCPKELASNYLATAIMDNDDFKDDTLTGADTSHRTNVMFVQKEELKETNNHSNRPVLTKHHQLKSIAEELNKIIPYKTIVKGVPLVRQEFDITPSNTMSIRLEEMIHTVTRIDQDYCSIPANQQKVGSFSGFQSIIQNPVSKSKPYYFFTLSKPPHKSVVHEVMNRLKDVVEEKNIPFMQLVGDQPVYTLIVQTRYENCPKFDKIIPVLGSFHTQCSFIYVINKRFSGSGLSDIIVSANIVADKSIYQAMKGKHYRRALRALQLTYESLQRRIVQKGLANGLSLSQDIKESFLKLQNPSSYSREELQDVALNIRNNKEFNEFMTQTYTIIEEYRSPMADYWLSYMEMVEILMMNIHAIKVKDWVQYLASLR